VLRLPFTLPLESAGRELVGSLSALRPQISLSLVCRWGAVALPSAVRLTR
jgi:hypothetical protein